MDETRSTPSTSPHLSVVVPVYNEADLLVEALRRVRDWLERRGRPHEIIVCENGSADTTASLARSLAAQWPALKVSTLPQANYGLALRQGLERAGGWYIAVLNVDFLDMEFLQQALNVIERDGLDVVIGSKRLPASSDQRSAARRWMTRAFNQLLAWCFHTRLTDTHGLKVLRLEAVRPLVAACVLDAEMFDTELLLRAERAGLRIRELPVSLRDVRPTRYPVWVRIPATASGLLRLLWHVNWRQGSPAISRARMFYDTIADRFDGIMNPHEIGKRLRMVFDDCLRDTALSGAFVLDAGCGTGEFSHRAAARGARVVAVDLGLRLVDQARRKVPQLWGVVGDATVMPFAEETFDYIICSEMLEHTTNPRQAVGELCRVLKPGGCLVVTVPNRLWG